jgi:hypothetical protein
MAYIITSDRLDCDKAVGDSITAEELLEMEADIDALISAGHIADATTKTNSAPSEGATK